MATTREVNRQKTEQSVADGFGGDLYRRREVSPNKYQCGCEWRRNDPEAVVNGVRGDVLFECVLHKQATAASLAEFERERRKL